MGGKQVTNLTGKSILITGGTRFGQRFVPSTLAKHDPKRIVVYSRDEMKQWEMAKQFADDPRVQFLIGDVRDRDRLIRALDGIDVVGMPRPPRSSRRPSTIPSNASRRTSTGR